MARKDDEIKRLGAVLLRSQCSMLFVSESSDTTDCSLVDACMPRVAQHTGKMQTDTHPLKQFLFMRQQGIWSLERHGQALKCLLSPEYV
jgi:hypothetical protein